MPPGVWLPLERPVSAAGGLDALDGDQAVEFVELPRQHQHQAEGMLGAGDVGAAPQREQLDAFLGAGGGVDVAQARAEFLHDLEPARRGKVIPLDAKRLDHQRDAVLEVRAHLGLGRHHPHLGGIESRPSLAARARTSRQNQAHRST